MKTINSIIEILANYQPTELNETPLTAAVMVILLIDEHDEIEIVLTKRAATLLTYAGHYSFPGGVHDESDTNLLTTAIREVHEELDLSPTSYQLSGQLDDFKDRYGNLVRPFVAWMNKTQFKNIIKFSPDEIADIYYFSLSKLTQIQDEPSLHAITRRRPSYAYKEGEVFVWGLTAAILVHFSNIINETEMPLGKKIK